MKFCKALDREAQNLPDHLRVFLSYKLLKTIIKDSAELTGSDNEGVAQRDQALLDVLKHDVERLNNFFMSQEEDALIQIEQLADQLRQVQACLTAMTTLPSSCSRQAAHTGTEAELAGKQAGSCRGVSEAASGRQQAEGRGVRQLQEQGISAEHEEQQQQPECPWDCKQRLLQIKQELVDFHGQMVMLNHWSSLNYNGVSKILKKYDKHTKGNLRGMYMGLLKQQAFIQTEQVSEFARRADALAQEAASLAVALSPLGAMQQSAKEPEMARLVLRALNTWQHLATSASTPSTIMLAPVLGGTGKCAAQGATAPAEVQSQVPASGSGSSSCGSQGRKLGPVAIISKHHVGHRVRTAGPRAAAALAGHSKSSCCSSMSPSS